MKKTASKNSLNYHTSETTTNKPATKIELCLSTLLNRHETTTFEANRLYGDTCLHSTISAIEKQHRIKIARSLRKIRGRHTNAAIAHYRLDGDNVIKAKIITNNLRVSRGANTESRWSYGFVDSVIPHWLRKS